MVATITGMDMAMEADMGTETDMVMEMDTGMEMVMGMETVMGMEMDTGMVADTDMEEIMVYIWLRVLKNPANLWLCCWRPYIQVESRIAKPISKNAISLPVVNLID